MKTDKELLELAAKAAGYNIKAHEDGTLYSDCRCAGYWGVWNPLTDDGDTLRLAVKLNITFVFDFNLSAGESFIRAGVELPNLIIERVLDGDKLAATRRAIVRAAAVSGERL